ncbi:MAG TPA: hypothetical protein VFE52_11945, partial [Devosia sp.]|nr:hypothetical protein [Devosia sp.]
MSTAGRMGIGARETLLALLVLALTFLNYGHQAVAAPGYVHAAADIWCGDPLLPEHSEHAPCHACRLGSGADLPPRPATVSRVLFTVVPVVYAPVLATGATVNIKHRA